MTVDTRWKREVSTSKMGLWEGVKCCVEPQVSEKSLIITCMASCYLYTGGRAAARLQRRPAEPFIRRSSDALPGALLLAGLLGVDAITDFPHNGCSITAVQETTINKMKRYYTSLNTGCFSLAAVLSGHTDTHKPFYRS